MSWYLIINGALLLKKDLMLVIAPPKPLLIYHLSGLYLSKLYMIFVTMLPGLLEMIPLSCSDVNHWLPDLPDPPSPNSPPSRVSSLLLMIIGIFLSDSKLLILILQSKLLPFLPISLEHTNVT